LLQNNASSLTFCLKDASATQNGDTTATGAKCKAGPTPGSYQIVGLVPGDHSAQSYYAELSAQCSEDVAIGKGDIIDVQTGNIVGPTNKGVDNYCPNGGALCYMKFVFYDNYLTSGNPAPTGTATDGASCSGGNSGTNPCYNIVSVGAAVISTPAKQGLIQGYFTLMNDPGGEIGTTPSLLKRVILVQ
jgi:hypothetical protein